MELLRDFTNRPGMTFDPDKTFILYAEDLEQIKENFALLNQMLSLSRQYGTSFIGAIKQGDLPEGETTVPTVMEVAGGDVLDATNTNRGGDVAIRPGINNTTSEKGNSHIGSSDGSVGYSVAGETTIHRYLPIDANGFDSVMTNDESDYLIFKPLQDFSFIQNLMRFFTSQLPTYQSGLYYSSDRSCENSEVTEFAPDSFVLVPFFCSQNLEISDLGISVFDSGGSGAIKVGIYESNSEGMPGTGFALSSSIDADSSGFMYWSPDTFLTKGKVYWLAFRSRDTISILTSARSTTLNFGLSDPANDSFFSCLSTTLDFDDSWPDGSAFTHSDFSSTYKAPSFRFLVA